MSSTNPDELSLLADKNPREQNTVGDRFVYWPLVLTFGSPIILVLVWTAPDPWGFIGVLTVYFLWCGSALGVLIVALIWLYRQQWRRAASAIILPASALAAVLNLNFVAKTTIWAGDRLELLATFSRYSREISNLPHQEGPRVATFMWRDLNGFGMDLGYVLLVYDESDEIALPAGQRSAAWRENAGSDLQCRLTGVEHVFGHYYFVGRGFDC